MQVTTVNDFIYAVHGPGPFTAPSSGGGGGVSQGAGAPGAAPSDPTIAWVYTDLTAGTLYSWDVNLQAWI